MNNRKRNSTVLELMVVALMVAILTLILAPQFSGVVNKANEQTAIADARSILIGAQALEASGTVWSNDTMTKEQIESFVNLNFDGALALDDTPGCFVYTVTIGGREYSVDCDNYRLSFGRGF